MSGMRILLSRLDQLRRATVEGLPAYSDAIVSQFEEIKSSTDAWAGQDHNDDGTHSTVRLGNSTGTPDPTVGRITLFNDGDVLKAVLSDGTVKTITWT